MYLLYGDTAVTLNDVCECPQLVQAGPLAACRWLGLMGHGPESALDTTWLCSAAAFLVGTVPPFRDLRAHEYEKHRH